ncbi:MAG TPA: SPOR domain-containing protein, partial [Candidatus Eisenbacteria bacterium]
DGRPSASLWRVQVFVTQDRGQADRMAKEAQERLRVRAHIAYEASQYKVRLGDYGTEDEAQPLRERAVRSGFPGAFRVRCAPDRTDDIN